MKPFIMQFYPSFTYYLSLRSKCSPLHPVLKNPESVCLAYGDRPSFTPTLINR